MEIHHKHHHEPPGKHESAWKHYLFEFIMLFLAVTAGYLVENQREHYIENKREKQFIRSFIEDLNDDSIKLSQLIIDDQSMILKTDSLLLLLNQDNPNSNELYYYARYSTRRNFFKSNDRTITQLKNSGGLRLIRNQQASNMIVQYQLELDDLQTSRTIAGQEIIAIYEYIAGLFDATVFDTMVKKDGTIVKPESHPRWRNADKSDINKLKFYLHQKKTSLYFSQKYFHDLINKVTLTKSYLGKHYDLEI